MALKCEFCGKKFESRKSLKIHKGKKHPRAVQTKIDEMLELVKGEGEIALGEISEKMEIEKSKVEKWGRALDRFGLVDLVFPENPLRNPYLKVKNGEE